MADPFTDVSISSFNANPPPDDGTVSAENEATWANIKSKLADPLKTAIESLNTNVGAAVDKLVGGGGVSTDGSGATLTAGIQGKIVRQTANGITTTMPDATSVNAPFIFMLLNDGGGDNTIDTQSAQTINGNASITVPDQTGALFGTDGSNWFAIGLTPEATTTALGMIELATDAETQALTATDRAVTPSNLAAMVPSQAEMETGTSNARFVTPGRQHFHPGHPKAWAKVTVSGGTPSIQQSYNITGISDGGAGILGITIDTDFTSANHWVASVSLADATNRLFAEIISQAAGSMQVRAYEANSYALTDPEAWHFIACGDQA